MEEGTPPGATNALKRTFNEFDKDRSGKIDKGELKSALESLGKRVNDASLTKLIQQVDVNQDGQIDFTEFVQLACEDRQSRPMLRPET
jgi:calmodulin